MYRVDYNFQKELKDFLSWGSLCTQKIVLISGLYADVSHNNNAVIEKTADILIAALQMAEIYGYEDVMDAVDYKIQQTIGKMKEEMLAERERKGKVDV